MRSSILVVLCLAVICFANYADAASKCYACSGLKCGAEETNCGNSLNFCQKVVTSTAGVDVIVKSCADNCVDGYSQTFGPSTVKYQCCTGDLCNAGISQFTSSKYLALSLVLMVASFFYTKY